MTAQTVCCRRSGKMSINGSRGSGTVDPYWNHWNVPVGLPIFHANHTYM